MEEALDIRGRGGVGDSLAAASTADPVDERLPPGPVVKLCGLTRVEDVRVACRLGVWALGFVFAASPRRLSPAAARALAEEARRASAGGERGVQPPGPLLVGVFTDAPAAEIARVVGEVGLDAVQLHGLQTPAGADVRSAVGNAGACVIVIRAVPMDPAVSDAASLQRAVLQAREGADVLLFDTCVDGRFGGSGCHFPWRMAREAARMAGRELRFLVAGGIGPDNVRTALAESGAWGVDVSSGIESAPGIKDRGLMARLVTGVEEGVAL